MLPASSRFLDLSRFDRLDPPQFEVVVDRDDAQAAVAVSDELESGPPIRQGGCEGAGVLVFERPEAIGVWHLRCFSPGPDGE
jgi:hypothetical protein